MSDDRIIEAMARAMAEATNGGSFYDGRWFAEEHRQLWRTRATAALTAYRKAAWRPIGEAVCDDQHYLVQWNGGHMSVEDFDHDSDPQWWAERGATHFQPLPESPDGG